MPLSTGERLLPKNRVSEVVSNHWRAVLGITETDSGDDFFGLGGNSLLAITLVEGVERELGIDFPLEVLFLDGTLAALISACETEVGG